MRPQWVGVGVWVCHSHTLLPASSKVEYILANRYHKVTLITQDSPSNLTSRTGADLP